MCVRYDIIASCHNTRWFSVLGSEHSVLWNVGASSNIIPREKRLTSVDIYFVIDYCHALETEYVIKDIKYLSGLYIGNSRLEIRNNMDNEKNIEFIKNDLLPEAVHDRCFCETGSREFVEFVSVDVESSRSFEKIQQRATKYYRARLIVNFSNEPKIFALMIKLLNHANNDEQEKRDYDEFLNEEMFYGKMTKKYKLNVYPRCYVADMGRYDGRPVIVLEDLEASGYVRVNDKLDEDHLVLALRAIEGLHERGFRLKAQNFNSFREFYAKLNDTRLDAQSTNVFTEASNRISRILRKLRYGASEKVELEKDENLFTMCHGNLIPHECFFFKYENKKPVDVRIIGWNRMRYCSIVHDLAYILHDRIFNEDEVEKYLRVYIKAADK